MKAKTILFSLLFLAPALFAQDMVIIIHPANNLSEMDQRDLKNVFLGKKSQWEDGSAIYPVIQQKETLQEAFLKAYIGRGKSQFDTYWKRMIFTGQGSPPKALVNEEAVISYVAETPGAIGFVRKTMAEGPNVKVLEIK